MIDNVLYIVSNSLNPYYNLALEQTLFSMVTETNFIVYLWRNIDTVLIGRNQNAYAECKIENIQNDKGFLARRLSGGGAVFQDKGNVNFTFLTQDHNYSVAENFDCIIKAVKEFGIKAEINGRNDILVNGLKFSGNAFFKSKGINCHHGTVLIDINTHKLERFLNVSPLKLKTKGIKSVKSRVINLKQLNNNINWNNLQHAIIEAVKEKYQSKNLLHITERDLEKNLLNKNIELLSNPDFIYGKHRDYEIIIEEKLDWGLVSVGINIQSGIIADIAIYTDSLNIDQPRAIENMLKGQNINCLSITKNVNTKMAQDIINIITR